LTRQELSVQLSSDRLNTALFDPKIEVMNFLNEVTSRYPQAISFAPGRPLESSVDVAESLQYIDDFVGYDARMRGTDVRQSYAMLGQYGRTKGVIGQLIAELLQNDEAVTVAGDDIVVTVGGQEAMCLCLAVLCGNRDDVALVIDPAYIGMSGAARVLGIELAAVPAGDRGIDLAALERTVAELSARGKQARVLYLSPDYANPTGITMTLELRKQLLALTRRLNLLVLEDHAYSYFSYDDERLAPLKAMDGAEHVLYLGSFAKSIYPGLRLGFVAADQTVIAPDGRRTRLADEFSKAKSLFTVNSSHISQAIAAGLLVRHACSLKTFVAPRRQVLKRNRDAMIAALERNFPRDSAWAKTVHWNRPSGGFFLTLTVPFAVTDDDLMSSAADYGVTWTPMSYFCLNDTVRREIRLSFSYVNTRQIDDGIARLASLVASRVKAAS
jgi:(S)-3,5-dihydroxyphenylglycine transaminase